MFRLIKLSAYFSNAEMQQKFILITAAPFIGKPTFAKLLANGFNYNRICVRD